LSNFLIVIDRLTYRVESQSNIGLAIVAEVYISHDLRAVFRLSKAIILMRGLSAAVQEDGAVLEREKKTLEILSWDGTAREKVFSFS
jgi:ABC-type sugar transport system ATPase subunit